MNKVLFLLSWIVGIIGLLFALLGIIKLFTLSSKSLPILFFCFGILLIGLAILPYSVDLSQIRWLRLTYRLVCGLVAIGVLCGGIVSCFMAFGVHTWKGKDFQGTVVVLGTLIIQDQPSRMLKARLDAAVAFLKENPKSSCIVSGGQGKNEDYTEAEIMEKYLVQQGIDPSRIYQEGNSSNTKQNLQYSLQVIQQNHLGEQIVIITNAFHRYRAQIFADQLGVTAYSVSGTCRFDLEFMFWFREIAAVLKAWITGI